MIINKKKIKSIIIIGLLFLTFLSTQFMYSLNIGDRNIYIYYVEMYIIILCFISAFDILFNKKKIKFKKIVLIFLLWFIIISMYRYFFSHDITGGFIIFRVLFFPLILVFLLKQYSINRRYVLLSLILFVTFINVSYIYDLIFISNSFRVVHVLKNLNIYLCFTISAIPLMLLYLKEYYTKKTNFNTVIKSIVFLNIILISIFSFLSGSRIGLLLCPLVVILSYFFVYKINKKNVLRFSSLMISICISSAFIAYFDLYDSRENIFRSIEPIIKVFKNENDDIQKIESIEKVKNVENFENNYLKNNSNIVDNSNHSSTMIDSANEDNSSVIDSNNMRLSLWKKSIYYISKNPIFGKGSTDIDIDMYFSGANESTKLVQSPHNFILEMCIAFGIPGMFIYMFIIVASVVKIFRQKIDKYNKFNFLLSLVSILGFSSFQPLVTSYFVISILLWINYYIYLKEF